MVNPLTFLATSIFADSQKQASIMSGRSWLSLSEIGGISNLLAVPVLPTLLSIFATPKYNPPDWLPVLPFSLELPVDPKSWVGQKGTKPQDPRDDPFYHPDISTYADKENGEILALRQVGLSTLWVNVDRAYQISYRTESTLGWPQADITTVIIPNNPNGKVVSYHLWQDSCSLQCSPSYTTFNGIQDPTIDLLFLLGFVVNYPDHQGINGSYTAGRKEGKSTLDSIRAFLSAREQVGLDTNGYDKIVMWGYSGGSIPTAHAAELLPTYSPELDGKIIGATAGGVVANITQVAQTINGGIFAGFLGAAIWGLGTEYPEIQQVIDEQVRPGIRWRFNYIGKRCLVAQLINFIFQNMWGYMQDKTGKSIFADPRVANNLQYEWMGVNGAPPTSIPFMIYHGVQDEINAIKEVDRTVDSWCKAGSRVDYYRLGATAHLTTQIFSLVEAIEFIYKVFDGYVPAACSGYQEATKATTVYLGSKQGTSQYNAVVAGNWQNSGVLAKLKADGYYSG